MASTRDSTQDLSPEPPAPVGVLVGFGGDPLTVGLIFFGIASWPSGWRSSACLLAPRVR